MYKIMSNEYGSYAVFKWMVYGKFWQQYSKWYVKKGTAQRFLEKMSMLGRI